MAKIVVTGSTGFIGLRLVNQLKLLGNQVYTPGRTYEQIDCDIIYHLACPSDNKTIYSQPILVMDTIMDVTRKALNICSRALFVFASSKGAEFIGVDNGPQNCYNVAKLCMETYIEQTGRKFINYRLPSVYGPGANPDSFIQKCVNGTAYRPSEPDKPYYIAHIDQVVKALSELRPLEVEQITVGEIYEQFNSGRRGIHR